MTGTGLKTELVEKKQDEASGDGSSSSESSGAKQASWGARVTGLSGYRTDTRRVAGVMLISLGLGLIIAGLAAWANAVFAILWSAACTAVGAGVGFVFGIPRTLQTDGQTEVRQTVQEGKEEDVKPRVTARRTTGVNTNLEQISDWLTKIFVGVTLVQLGEFGNGLRSTAAVIAEATGSGARYQSFAYALMVYFAIVGFLGSYLLTRLFLQRAFEQQDDSNSREEPA